MPIYDPGDVMIHIDSTKGRSSGNIAVNAGGASRPPTPYHTIVIRSGVFNAPGADGVYAKYARRYKDINYYST